MRIHALKILTFLLLYVAAVPCRAQDKVTILYDAFGESKELTKDWGYSALVEHNGKQILFDTGNDAVIFEHNVKALGVDLTKLDFVVISHWHADHTTGLRYVLKVNPNVTLRPEGTFGPMVARTRELKQFWKRQARSIPERRLSLGDCTW